MASTITIQNTVNWAKAFLEQQPLEINGMEPALSSANLILQTLLGPPFVWAWNRSILNFSTDTQDSQQIVNDFGFLEEGTVEGSDGKPWALGVRQTLHVDSSGARPQWCAPYIDDGVGNITFRLVPSPAGDTYTVTLPYQRSAPTIMSLGTSWYPVPDENNYLCQWGFLALMSLIGNDARFGEYNNKFVTTLLSIQGGLTEMERNMFLGNWLRVQSQVQSTQLGTAERYRAREM
jgi:hypothetical protein